jgi:hypothetical protein
MTQTTVYRRLGLGLETLMCLEPRGAKWGGVQVTRAESPCLHFFPFLYLLLTSRCLIFRLAHLVVIGSWFFHFRLVLLVIGIGGPLFANSGGDGRRGRHRSLLLGIGTAGGHGCAEWSVVVGQRVRRLSHMDSRCQHVSAYY